MYGTTNNSQLNEILAALKSALNPKKVYLFGSRARGDFHDESDYDFVLIVGDQFKDKRERREIAYEALKNIKPNTDFFIYTQAEFDEWKDELSSIPETALRQGRELELG